MRALPIIAAAAAECVTRGATAPAVAVSGVPRPDVRDEDLPALLAAFYATVGGDPLLAPYFAPIDMSAHIPRLADFWSTLLFHSGRYQGNAFRPHQAMPGLDSRHFVRWLETFEATVDARHAGPVAEEMKAVGQRIAYSMQLRLDIIPFGAQ